MKLTITELVRKDKNKDGLPYKWPSGDTYVRLAIQTQEHGQNWLSCAESRWNAHWKKGDIVEAEVEKSPDGKWLNLKKIDELADLKRRVSILENIVLKVKAREEDQPF